MFWTRANDFHRYATSSSKSDLFSRFMGGQFFAPRSRIAAPAFNIWSDADGAVLTSEIPGVALDDLEITVNGSIVTVKGGRREELKEGQTRTRGERLLGGFERAFDLSFRIDPGKVEAKLADGVLEIALPRAEEDKPRKIAVNG